LLGKSPGEGRIAAAAADSIGERATADIAALEGGGGGAGKLADANKRAGPWFRFPE
jgi:hypothetical protein